VDTTRKIKKCFSVYVRGKPFGDCHFKTEWLYLIHEIRRDGRGVIFCYGYPRQLEYRLAEQYAKAVSDDDNPTVNTYTTLYYVVKRGRDDGSGIADLNFLVCCTLPYVVADA